MFLVPSISNSYLNLLHFLQLVPSPSNPLFFTLLIIGNSENLFCKNWEKQKRIAQEFPHPSFTERNILKQSDPPHLLKAFPNLEYLSQSFSLHYS